MNNFFINCFKIIAILASIAISANAAPPLAPTHTRVIDNFEQLGIDTPHPRFGWVVNDIDRGDMQTAYQIIVLTTGNNTIWNSGKVTSAQQFGVTYSGNPLSKTTKYWWKVRTWDKNDQVSPWSQSCSFATSFFQMSDWDQRAVWIRHPQAESKEVNPLPMFRKSFKVEKPFKQAWLYICGLGQFVASMNGTGIGDHITDPAWTDYDKTVSYVTFDVTSNIKQGVNALGVMLGNGWYVYKGMRDFGTMKLKAQLHVDYIDGTSVNIVSDSTWKVKNSPYTLVSIHGTENYDARDEVAGWDMPHINDSDWLNAKIAVAPSGKLCSQSSAPVKALQVFKPSKIAIPETNVYVYDFGQNMNGQFEVKVSGPAGTTIKIRPGEDISSKGRVVASDNTKSSQYTLKGNGIETFRLTFSSIGFRYMEVENASQDSLQTTPPCIHSVKAYFTYTASNNIGSFNASDDRYNKIYNLALNTLRSNLVSIHTDGPHYEKLGWQEVAWTLLPSVLYQHDLYNLYSKIAGDIRNGQRNVGLCPDITPNYWTTTTTTPGNAYDDSPAWGASAFMVPWQLFTNYGDKKILQDNYETMKSYLAYLKTKETVSGLIVYGLGDWMTPGGAPVANVEGAIYVLDTRIMRDVARVMGKTSDADFYTSEYERVKKAYNSAYYNAKDKTYQPVSQTSLSLPLAFGIVPKGDEIEVERTLINDIKDPQENGKHLSYGTKGEFGPVLPFHVTTGDIGTTFLWRALGDAGQSDLVQTMIMQDSAPGYMNYIDNGFTTIGENWNLSKCRSHNHDMYAGIFEWLYRSLGGISPLKPGYEEILFKPGFPKGLSSLSLSTNTVKGLVSSAWKVNGEHIKWDINIPTNATAKVYILFEKSKNNKFIIKESQKTIWKNGSYNAKVAGISFDHIERNDISNQNYIVLNAGSGSYQFQW